jgi:hypothetical protein
MPTVTMMTITTTTITIDRSTNLRFLPQPSGILPGGFFSPKSLFNAPFAASGIRPRFARRFDSLDLRGLRMTQRAVFNAVASALGAALVLASNPAASADAPFNTLNGTWGGEGTLAFDDGPSEKLTCLGYYKSPSDGKNLSLVIRCHGDPDKLELRAKLDYETGKLSGTWEERTFNAAGEVTGLATEKGLDLKFSGSLDGTMLIAFSSSAPSTQSVSVTITTANAGLKGAQISLNRR